MRQHLRLVAAAVTGLIIGACALAWAAQTNYLGVVFIADPTTVTRQMTVNSDGSINVTPSSGGTQDVNLTKILGAAPSATNPLWVAPATASTPWATVITAGTANIGNVGGKTVTTCVTPTVTTANAYGTNYVVGGLLTFTNAMTTTGTGIIQGVTVTIAKVETSGFTFFPFNANPSATTWTDAAVANINVADVPKVRNPVALGANSQLGTHTVASSTALGQATSPGATIYGVLIANAALTNNFTAATDVQVCITVLQDL